VPIDLERMRVAARRAALVGGDAIRGGRRPAQGEAKGLPGDWVTEVDVASETAIRLFLQEETPDVPMLGEESGGVVEGLRWIVDPLDGTTNFLHRFPAVGVSVALVEGQLPLAGRSTRPSSATRGMPRAAPERSGNPQAEPRNRATCPNVRRNGR
jgi:myo-inositol-1(or 4)-monophosphatase